ncbi:hypothetical protein F542_20850 [Bibersteinia trehalosi USDA-ARS-USMARC-188]|uniref:Uncharacterized protein n=1 Tax=Bibersteinia trehalosi USDA-ARS-USMARC-188 TaxID=1263829 RepID=A0A4V7ICN7_BIBTR|nr:hypothetical protein F542_20850 [Bibersteinia trehalosi USDA-ARS-USMARC-188]
MGKRQGWVENGKKLNENNGLLLCFLNGASLKINELRQAVDFGEKSANNHNIL